MQTSALRSDIAVATLCLAVIVVLGAVVAISALKDSRTSASFGVAAATDATDLTEYRQARGTRPLAEAGAAAPRPAGAPAPRRGDRSLAPFAAPRDQGTIAEATPGRPWQ